MSSRQACVIYLVPTPTHAIAPPTHKPASHIGFPVHDGDKLAGSGAERGAATDTRGEVLLMLTLMS
jgi:hypothetical protein